MGYLHIENLYKAQDILLFKECYALEKIHGSSSHITWKDGRLQLSSGGADTKEFSSLFDIPALEGKFKELIGDGQSATVYGEAYGGKLMGMSETYGPSLRFVAFDVKIGGLWLAVPQAAKLVENLGLEFVHYNKVLTRLKDLDGERDADSVQAIRNGVGPDKIREGVVLRPLIELRKNNDERIIAKHKRDEFRETSSPRPATIDPERLKKLEDANEIADEWVTAMRMEHILGKMTGELSPRRTPEVIAAMQEDVLREGDGEIVDSPEVRKAIGRKAAEMLQQHLKGKT
jgi:hypothetical protein